MKTVIEMAREAGIRDCTCNGTLGCLERLVELARADEREACAKVCEQGEFMTFGCVAEAIRARGQA
tara:strand:+ start:1700 stop:1897 length:198 start_codon:yes stop_codon:yes gene_type:complete